MNIGFLSLWLKCHYQDGRAGDRQSHTALLKSHYRGDNAHSFACVRLFLRVVCFILDQTIVASDKCLSYARILLFPTGTQYPVGTHYTVSCVGFMTRCPSGRLPRYARNDIFYPQRAEGTHRAAGNITFRATEHIVEKRPTHASWSFFWSE